MPVEELPTAREIVEAVLRDDFEVLIRWRTAKNVELALGKHGGARVKGVQGSVTTPKRGRGAAYLLARLRRDRPDLAERVTAGELSINAASIEAGFRKRTVKA